MEPADLVPDNPLNPPLSKKYLLLAFGSAFFLPLLGLGFGLYTLCKGRAYLISALFILGLAVFSFIFPIGPLLLQLALMNILVFFYT